MIKEYLVSLGYNNIDIEKILNAYSLNSLKENTLLIHIKEIYDLLISLGYSNENIIRMTNVLPALYSLSAENIKKKIDEIIEQAKQLKAEDVKEMIVKKVNELQAELKDLDKEKVLKVAKQKAKKIQKKAEELYKLAVEKGTPVLEKATRELKEATAEALKKIVAKLEAE